MKVGDSKLFNVSALEETFVWVVKIKQENEHKDYAHNKYIHRKKSVMLKSQLTDEYYHIQIQERKTVTLSIPCGRL